MLIGYNHLLSLLHFLPLTKRVSVGDSIGGALLVEHEEALHLGGADGVAGTDSEHIVGESLAIRRRTQGVKSLEHCPQLLGRAVADPLLVVHSPGSDEGFIQSFLVVCGHEHNPPFCGRNAVDGVEKTAQSQPPHSLVDDLTGRIGVLPAPGKGCVHVLQKNDGVLRGVGEAML